MPRKHCRSLAQVVYLCERFFHFGPPYSYARNSLWNQSQRDVSFWLLSNVSDGIISIFLANKFV